MYTLSVVWSGKGRNAEGSTFQVSSRQTQKKWRRWGQNEEGSIQLKRHLYRRNRKAAGVEGGEEVYVPSVISLDTKEKEMGAE